MPTLGRRRALGQHFLKDRSVCEAISDAAVKGALETGSKALLEIGPGKGAITEPLLTKMERHPEIEFFLCERDPDLARYWQTQKKDIRVELEDFNQLPEERWLTKSPLTIVSNLPYSAGTAILTRLARQPKTIPFMVLMFQAEVAQRLRAEASTKAWGSLSVWIQNQWDVVKLLTVPPRAFSPPPDVMSEVVTLTRRESPRISAPLSEPFLRACFAHRRKMLRSGLPPGPYRNALETSGVDGTKRAEALSWEEWQRLFESLSKLEA